MTKFSYILFILFGVSSFLSAQEMGYGFKAGLNFSTFQSPTEEDDNGNMLEENQLISGFHIGAIINFKFTEIAGLRTELMFSQKGTRYSFEGPSYQSFYIANQANSIATTGQKDITLNITNAYIDVPVMGYIRALPWLEISGGASIGALVSSIGAGELSYSGTTETGFTVDDVIINLDYNYLNNTNSTRNTNDAVTEMVGLQTIEIPRNIGPYYDHELYGETDFDDKQFNRLDIGLVGGINIFLNQGLALGIRINYGLIDITKNTTDYSYQNLSSERRLIFSEDSDRNLSLQTSIGFSF